MTEWVAGRLDVSHDTARVLMRAARHVPDHPRVAERFTSGEIGLDRAVATAELAAVAPDHLVADAERRDLGSLRRQVQRWRRRGPRTDTRVFIERFLSLQSSLDNGTVRGVFEVPGFEGDVVAAALTTRAELFGDLPGPRIPTDARLADALVSIAQDSLEGLAWSEEHGRTEPVVSIFLDAAAASSRGEAGAELAAGPRVGPAVLEEVLCTGKVGVVFLEDGEPVSASPTTRSIPPAIRRLVSHRDGGCSIEGCRSRYRLQPHHLIPFAAGGSHDVENLTTLCWFHHHVVVHRLGHRIDPDTPSGRRRFLRERTRPPPS